LRSPVPVTDDHTFKLAGIMRYVKHNGLCRPSLYRPKELPGGEEEVVGGVGHAQFLTGVGCIEEGAFPPFVFRRWMDVTRESTPCPRRSGEMFVDGRDATLDARGPAVDRPGLKGEVPECKEVYEWYQRKERPRGTVAAHGVTAEGAGTPTRVGASESRRYMACGVLPCWCERRLGKNTG
jgi:hypothetical protein